MVSAYLFLKGEKIGKVRGPVRERDKEGSIAILTLEHSIVSPRDAYTGLATGKRQHLPIALTKETDQTSPLLYRMLTTNELMPTVEIKFFGQSTQGLMTGREIELYNITLVKAFISKIEFSGRPDEEAKLRLRLGERVYIVYETIKWHWAEGNIDAQDNFNAGPGA